MSANAFGNILKISTFGESHGPAMGVIIDGCPSGMKFDMELLKKNLERRRPGQSSITTSRNEQDTPEVLSGVFQDKTLGTPICIIVRNQDQKSTDYEQIKIEPRIGHADDTWKEKFGHIDYRGGGRSSGRETVCRVMAGSVAQMICKKLQPELMLKGYAFQIADFILSADEVQSVFKTDIDQFKTRFPSKKDSDIEKLLISAKEKGESYGGTVEVQVQNCPVGLGQPVFHKFKSDLAMAMLSIGATNSFHFGSDNDQPGTTFHSSMSSENYGGIRGGITTGDPIKFRVGFKPTSSIKDIAKKGRHDPCIIPRAVPVVEAMTWLTLADHLLWKRLDQI